MTHGGVLVTGSSTGIGRACALDLDRRGFRVFAGVRRQEDGAALQAQAAGRLVPVMLDVTDAGSIAAARETLERELAQEPLAGVVNNAGVAVGGPLEALAIDDLRRQLELNTIAPVAVTQAFIPLLRRSHGRVVNMGSISGRVSQPFLAPYSASKFALGAISDALRGELLPWGIHVALIEPGTVKTPIWDKAGAQVEAFRATATPEQRALYDRNLDAMERLVRFAKRTGSKPERVARAVAHALTSDHPRARYLVGVDARAQLAIGKLLPTRATDRLFARVAGS